MPLCSYIDTIGNKCAKHNLSPGIHISTAISFMSFLEMKRVCNDRMLIIVLQDTQLCSKWDRTAFFAPV